MRAAARQARRRHLRHRLLHLFTLLVAGVILARTFQLQVLDGDEWRGRAITQHETRVPLPAQRGAILDREGRELVVSRTTYRIAVAPLELRDRQAAAQELRLIIALQPRWVRRIAEGERRWVVLPGTHSAIVREELEKRIGTGIYPEPVVERFYPRGDLATEVIGRADAGGTGLSGIELAFDSLLTGQPGFGIRRRDATGASANWLVTPVVAPTAGTDIVLTIDAEFQALAESVLEDAVEESDATGGDLLIIKPETGEILAAASRRRGRVAQLAAATEPYEPGSTLKPFTASALLAEGAAKLTT